MEAILPHPPAPPAARTPDPTGAQRYPPHPRPRARGVRPEHRAREAGAARHGAAGSGAIRQLSRPLGIAPAGTWGHHPPGGSRDSTHPYTPMSGAAPANSVAATVIAWLVWWYTGREVVRSCISVGLVR
ncbi:hypothetical protein GCM10023322_40920 [Rugosimonospora acidiphila]|uniref:Uncharacterized protein n=1 Tax=Rugosimonospora acidiphila TaxID=556531 RepID=A0ABP9RY18_9ACTN